METVTMSEISILGGCGRNASWNWQRDNPDFPKPVGQKLGDNNRMNAIYSKAAAVAWLIRHGKIPAPEGYEAEPTITHREKPQAMHPQINNEIAQMFLRGQYGCFNRFVGPIMPGHRQTIRTQGVWPCA